MELSSDARQDLAEYQALQQQLQLLLMQKQQVQLQVSEGRKAEEQLQGYTGSAYRFAGGVLVEKKPDKLKEELKAERETLEMRSGALEKQEGKLVERLKALEAKLVKLQSSGMAGGQASAGARSAGEEGASVSSGPSITKRSKGAA